MFKQLQFDFKRMTYQKKYMLILTIISLLSIAFSAFVVYRGQSNIAVVKASLAQFRPFYWLICCYLICDLIMIDYHNGTIKGIIPYSSSRRIYLLSKVITSITTCYLILLTHLCSTIFTTIVLSSQLDYLELGSFFFLSSVGATETILLFTGLLLLSMIITESEPVTIGFGLGMVFIMLILESIQQIADYVPTMQMIQLPLASGSEFKLGIWIAMVIVLFGIMSWIAAMQVFKRKDLFL